jgi:hypothetical protein
MPRKHGAHIKQGIIIIIIQRRRRRKNGRTDKGEWERHD